MHSKQKGNIAFTATILELQKNGFNVFTELGDLSKVDLIAEKNGKFVTIQVKYCQEINGALELPLRKSGPNGYKYIYSENDINWFSVYSSLSEKIYWVRSKEACVNKTVFIIRTLPVKTFKEQYKQRNADKFSISKLLRDFTQGTCNGDD